MIPIKWEYSLFDLKGRTESDIDWILTNEYGVNGWELVLIHKTTAYLKRPVAPEPKPKLKVYKFRGVKRTEKPT